MISHKNPVPISILSFHTFSQREMFWTISSDILYLICTREIFKEKYYKITFSKHLLDKMKFLLSLFAALAVGKHYPNPNRKPLPLWVKQFQFDKGQKHTDFKNF